ncbi:malate synthase a, putative [Ichthyophthirius multifiliis]|uniref:malate synthase n=1 Tax=Ichthyophthirius multifiliis TaxID=5932 RepID=G0QTP4_ICHMU|nr:malate synthase a, putative [Ichthyophthirius multifiliis]EGR31417.1 malate synthase a, putative [Ichthyophthirius multifiliis]|eukprot:XP_004034903.1 malate synthase a, putative [Ichthyophthirius multifiliis]
MNSHDVQTVIILEPNHDTNQLITPQCQQFLYLLHTHFNSKRLSLLQARKDLQKRLDNGYKPGFPEETKYVRESEWKVAPPPKDIERRWIELTGPPNPKICINALNSGADVFMADFEDALSPSWLNQISGQKCLIEANLKVLKHKENGKEYSLDPNSYTVLFARTRGWHLDEAHILVNGQVMSGALFDFGIYFFHNYQVRQRMGCGGIYYYLPKLESYFEARLWNEVFLFAQKYFNVPIGTIRCTVLIETLGGGLQMEEILYELKDHIVALNSGRWDYIFSAIKLLKNHKDCVLPDRSQVTMTVPFMKAYANKLVQVCHKRGAHAIGGMSAFIPTKNKEKNDFAYNKIREDKNRECSEGFDGSWVAHPAMVKFAREIFQQYLKGQANQKHVLRYDLRVTSEDIINLKVEKPITEYGVRENISITIQYIYYWLMGQGAVGINNLMEDAATAEISRSQIWQWIRHQAKTNDGKVINIQYYQQLRDQEVSNLRQILKNINVLNKAINITNDLIQNQEMKEFLTIEAYPVLNEIYKTQQSKL